MRHNANDSIEIKKIISEYYQQLIQFNWKPGWNGQSP